MNCWEILGISPTENRSEIDQAYERQRKFASGDELERLDAAYREASGEVHVPAPVENQGAQSSDQQNHQREQHEEQRELSANEQQIAREVIIQVQALLNDSRRAADEGIWKAILEESPANEPHVRAEIGRSIEAQLRPMAANGSFPEPVARYLGHWFGWSELMEASTPEPSETSQPVNGVFSETSEAESEQPPTVSFWPAVVGWIIALAVLASLFDGLVGG